MTIPIFRKGQWVNYDPPRELPPGWQDHHTYQAASVFATAHSLGHGLKESAALAEMYIFKQIFSGLCYDMKYETILKQILNHEETTSVPIKSERTETYE